MPVAIRENEPDMCAMLSGEIDHHTAKDLRDEIDESISRYMPQALTLDFSEVTFMDSSGIGLVMGRYRQLSLYGGRLLITGLNTQQKKVMRLAGLDKLASITDRKGE